MNILRNAILASVLVAGCASQAAEGLPEASIPFINLNQSIRQWQADGTQGLWIQDARKNWYYARLHTTCIGLDFAVSIGFETRTTNTLDRFSSIVVPRQPGNCPIASLTKSGGPPDDKKSRKPAE
jgi:hypothetical protein